jgi:hypothetical protein
MSADEHGTGRGAGDGTGAKAGGRHDAGSTRPNRLTEVPLPRAEGAEGRRLREAVEGEAKWRRFGPYLSERQWGTVREDYSANGDAWGYFPFDHAHLRAYRWGEDGLLGLTDNRGLICFALALWNGRDPILKERLFGLAGPEGNHGEDVKEEYYYEDSTPTHSYARALYKYPQAEFPYEELRRRNRAASKLEPEIDLPDTGVFDDDRYFDVSVVYAKAGPNDVLVTIEAHNRGDQEAPLWLLPTAFFRNVWSWGDADARVELALVEVVDGVAVAETHHEHFGTIRVYWESPDEVIFTDNDTNVATLYGAENRRPWVKDAFHRHVIHGERGAVHPGSTGSKAAGVYQRRLGPGERLTFRARLVIGEERLAAPFDGFDAITQERLTECDAFYEEVTPKGLDEPRKRLFRSAMAGLLWSKQYYHLDLTRWLHGDPGQPPPPTARLNGRNCHWGHLYNSEVISMPDKWEYPWYAAWDTAFHAVSLALVDVDYAKEQISLFLREWFMHPNGQIPAYEWAFSDVNPPVQAWAALRIYDMEKRMKGTGDRAFLEGVFHKLMLNFTWWVNRKDASGRNVFEGGFLGLDNIGVFDRSNAVPEGGTVEQADATSWMGMYCLNLLRMALELAQENKVYEDVANKFFEHFLHIAHAMNGGFEAGNAPLSLWDETDGFYYDVLALRGQRLPLRVRSMVGLIPLFGVEILEPGFVATLPGFVKRMRWFLKNRPDLAPNVTRLDALGHDERRLLALVDQPRLVRVLARMLDESEFLSPHGIRSLSRSHLKAPYVFRMDGREHVVDYEPAESRSGMFGGNSNWRGPVWFPMNFLLIEALDAFDCYYGDRLLVEHPKGSGKHLRLREIADDLAARLVSLFLPNAEGELPANGDNPRTKNKPGFRERVLFYEYFHGDTGAGLGASHQTGWTALVANLLARKAAADGSARAHPPPTVAPPPPRRP